MIRKTIHIILFLILIFLLTWGNFVIIPLNIEQGGGYRVSNWIVAFTVILDVIFLCVTIYYFIEKLPKIWNNFWSWVDEKDESLKTQFESKKRYSKDGSLSHYEGINKEKIK